MRLVVLVAHEAEAIRESALRVVRDAGFEGVAVADGHAAFALLVAEPPPAALVVDVGLPGRMGYELVEEIRARALPVRTILIASVYSKTAYKRRPTRLYGADDYLEQHHVPDLLGGKLARLLDSHGAPPAHDVHEWGRLSVEERAEVENIREAGEARLDCLPAREDAVAKARQVARLIVADIVLYNGRAVEELLPSGAVGNQLEKDLQAGRNLFELRVPAELAARRDFVGEAFDEIVASLRRAAESDPEDRGP